MQISGNPFRGGTGLVEGIPFPSVDVKRVQSLLSKCPAASETPLISVSDLAPIGAVWVKDERHRMNLGSFKALGAAYVIAREAAETAGENPGPNALSGRTYVTASAGNHGMSVVAGARVFGADAVIYIAETVPASFEQRLRDRGAKVIREGVDYAAAMSAAQQSADANGWTLLSDSSWAGYTSLPHILMEGYLQMADEVVRQCPDVPTHIFLQAGVGGMAGAVAAYARKAWGDAPKVVVVEPSTARALQASIQAGRPVFAGGQESIMGRLDCKEPSLIALNGLSRDADFFVTLQDHEVSGTLSALSRVELSTTPSGAAGLAAVLHPDVREGLEIGANSRVLCFLSEAGT